MNWEEFQKFRYPEFYCFINFLRFLSSRYRIYVIGYCKIFSKSTNFKKLINKPSHYCRNLKHNRIFIKEKALKNKNTRGIMASSYSICHLDGINEIDTRQRCQKPSNIKLSFIYLFLLAGRFRHSPCPFSARVKKKKLLFMFFPCGRWGPFTHACNGSDSSFILRGRQACYLGIGDIPKTK